MNTLRREALSEATLPLLEDICVYYVLHNRYVLGV